MKFINTKTNRGFPLGKFTDAYSKECKIQMSSAIEEEPHIWLGVVKEEVKIMCQDAAKLGLPVRSEEKGTLNGWQDYQLPSEVLIDATMYLSYSQVRQLIKQLKKFMRTYK